MSTAGHSKNSLLPAAAPAGLYMVTPPGDEKSNKAVNSSGVVQTGRGHAVYMSYTKKRETTVSETESLDTSVDGAEGGWTE